MTQGWQKLMHSRSQGARVYAGGGAERGDLGLSVTPGPGLLGKASATEDLLGPPLACQGLPAPCARPQPGKARAMGGCRGAEPDGKPVTPTPTLRPRGSMRWP